ncbi:hypothetical protein TWF225_003561 [Orbilia oligospora]|nr:hypothetical protein TWF225_003561 [Orbilia oligospora]KAF3259496.1 hypothetical protein TWF217_005192 [Orbilia oligospora]KAF3263980.1 hypothetical protein TWF128_001612 [Orbilia oligospora]KAF3287802.1 hypothetical protein TWF132_008322 [Orbilia oligospora]
MDEKVPFISADERKAEDFDLEGLPDNNNNTDNNTEIPNKQEPSPRYRLLLVIISWVSFLALVRFIFFFAAIWDWRAFFACSHHAHHHSAQSLPDVRPPSMPMCDYYALKNYNSNNAETQKLLIQKIVEKAFLGAKDPDAYFQRRFGKKSGMYNGVFRPGDMWGTPVDLTKYFDGSLNSTNVNGKPTQVNFYTTKTYTQFGREYPVGNELFMHMIKGMTTYIAPMLGCSVYGNTVDRYSGTRSLKDIHKYMDLGKDFEWAYFTHQLQLGALAGGKFSDNDSVLFELYLVDKFGPKIIDASKKKLSAPFENPELEASILPPKLDENELLKNVKAAGDVFFGNIKNAKRSFEMPSFESLAKRLQQQNSPSRIKRQNFNSAPPPLTTPVLAPSQTGTTIPTATHESSQSVPSNILPIALGAGIGAGLGVIIIGAVIAYLVIRKKRIEKRKSMPQLSLKPGFEMQKKDSVSRRVDRSEHGNVVGKPKDYDQRMMEEQELEPPRKGHKKSESVGVRSVRFSQHEG